MSNSSTSAPVGCFPPADTAFGPVVQACRDDFDFTIAFEQYFFSILPASLLLLAAPLRIGYLRKLPKAVTGHKIQAGTKLVSTNIYPTRARRERKGCRLGPGRGGTKQRANRTSTDGHCSVCPSPAHLDSAVGEPVRGARPPPDRVRYRFLCVVRRQRDVLCPLIYRACPMPETVAHLECLPIRVPDPRCCHSPHLLAGHIAGYPHPGDIYRLLHPEGGAFGP